MSFLSSECNSAERKDIDQTKEKIKVEGEKRKEEKETKEENSSTNIIVWSLLP